MKIQCDGYSGWWRECPAPGPTLAPGQVLSTEQVTYLTVAAMVLLAIVFGLVVAGWALSLSFD